MSEQSQQPIVFMYHGIVAKESLVPRDREVGAELYDVPLDSFRSQMAWLKNNEYVAGTLKNNAGTASPGSIILTFDDGEMNNFKEVFPVLSEYGFSAYFFVIAKRIGKQGYMGWDEIRKLHEAGMIIGSHGLSHEILTNLLETQIHEELTASKRHLETNLGVTVENFSIPRGFCNEKIIRMAHEAGYRHVFTSEGRNHLPEGCLSRVAVRGTWTLKRFEQAVMGEKPWNEKISAGAKRIAKGVLRESGYNWLRNSLIKLSK